MTRPPEAGPTCSKRASMSKLSQYARFARSSSSPADVGSDMNITSTIKVGGPHLVLSATAIGRNNLACSTAIQGHQHRVSSRGFRTIWDELTDFPTDGVGIYCTEASNFGPSGGGRYWDRTSDPCRVKAVLSR